MPKNKLRCITNKTYFNTEYNSVEYSKYIKNYGDIKNWYTLSFHPKKKYAYVFDMWLIIALKDLGEDYLETILTWEVGYKPKTKNGKTNTCFVQMNVMLFVAKFFGKNVYNDHDNIFIPIVFPDMGIQSSFVCFDVFANKIIDAKLRSKYSEEIPNKRLIKYSSFKKLYSDCFYQNKLFLGSLYKVYFLIILIKEQDNMCFSNITDIELNSRGNKILFSTESIDNIIHYDSIYGYQIYYISLSNLNTLYDYTYCCKEESFGEPKFKINDGYGYNIIIKINDLNPSYVFNVYCIK